MLCLVEIGPVVLEKKILKFRQGIFTILLLSPLGKVHGSSLEQIYLRMLCAIFGCNWPRGFGEEYILKFHQNIIPIRYYPLRKRCGPLFEPT